MTPELQQELQSCKTLPSPPGVATQIIELANDPQADINKIAKILSMDPAITTKILRIANSPMYGQSRKMENLRQAVIVIGLNATISLALSFSLLKSWQDDGDEGGLDYPLYWRRALLAATVSGVLARAAKLRDSEELFLACLIQDIGMLALDRTQPGLYSKLGDDQMHEKSVTELEIKEVGADHAEVGGWLLERWNFAERTQRAVAASHDPSKISESEELGKFARCVALTSMIAEVFLDSSGDRDFEKLAKLAESYLNVDKEALGEMLMEMTELIPDAESVFETQILIKNSPTAILDEAKEVLMIRSLAALQKVDDLEDHNASLEDRTRELEEVSKRDTLTGLFNRRALNDFLDSEFRRTLENAESLSIAYADLDKFKHINDTFGHQIGDQVLQTTAKILQSCVRSGDVVARYGGEEFVVAFPGTDSDTIQRICQRIVKAFQDTTHEVSRDEELTVTISIGTATFDQDQKFDSVGEFVQAADKALYRAKLEGRNRTVAFNLVA